MMKGRPHSIRTTRTSRATGESASHYRHLEIERSYDEGRALVNWYALRQCHTGTGSVFCLLRRSFWLQIACLM